MNNIWGPKVVRVENDYDGEKELIGLVLVDVRGDVVWYAPAVGWSDFDVREGYAEMLGWTAENPADI